MVDQVYKIVTGWDEEDEDDLDTAELASPSQGGEARPRLRPIPYGHISMLSGLLELVSDRGGHDDLYRLGAELLLEVDDLLPVTEAAELFHLAEVREGDLFITKLGQSFVEQDINERKDIIRDQLKDIPIFRIIARVLDTKANHAMNKEFFNDILEEHFSVEEAEHQLMTAINWGRYADIFHYDTDTEQLYLDEDQTGSSAHEATQDS